MDFSGGGGAGGWDTFTAEGKGGSGAGPQGISGPWQYIFCDEENVISGYDDITNEAWIKGGGEGYDSMTEAKFIGRINVNETEKGQMTVIRKEDQHVGANLNDDYNNQKSMFIKDDPVISWSYIEGMSGPIDMTEQERYLFSSYTADAKETYQKAYWLLPAKGTTNGGSISGDEETILAQEAATYENYRKAGVKELSINNHNATVSYSYAEKDENGEYKEENGEYLVGPFSLSYTRFFFKINGTRIRKENISDTIYSNGKVDFAGLVYMQVELDNGKIITLDEDNFVYTGNKSSLHDIDTGYSYPYEEDGEFYIKLTGGEVGDAHKITGISARYKTVQGSGGSKVEIESFYATGKLSVEVTNPIKCPGGTRGTCYYGACQPHEHTWWHFTGTNQSTGEPEGFLDTCPGKKPCEHGNYDCDVIIQVTDSFDVVIINDHVKNQKLVGMAGVAIVQACETVKSLDGLNLPLRMDYEGIVWEDTHTGKMQDQDGLLGAGEKGIEGVKVTITGTRYGHKYTTYTKEDGKYSFKDIKMDQYYATFEYDGQVWQPTTYFARGEDEFDVNSKAQENVEERIAFNNKFKEIIEQGGVSPDGTITEIEYDTKTTGKSYAITNNSFKRLSDDENVKFTGSDGLLYGGTVEGDYEKYKMTATTMEDTTPENTIDGQYNIISYPREDDVHIETWDKIILGTTYTALYQKARQINLGLVRRTAADFEVRKDVYKAIVQINGKTEEYTYSSRDNITESFDIEVKTGPDYGDVEYNRAIYRSDYNYRISDYADGAQLNKDSKANRGDGAGVADMISEITKAKGTDSELKIYIIYKITIANRSSVYAGTINELVDYYDEEYTYLESWYGTPTSTENTVVWGKEPKYNAAKEFEGYDTLYTQTTSGLMLNSGEMKDIYMKFEVNKHTDETGKEDSVFLDEDAVTGEYLGGKNNVVEINNYSTFKPGTTVEQKNVVHLVEGKIDKDSHPGNARADDKSTFEDDTDGAPRMNIILHQSEERSVFGYVWEDLRTQTLSSTGQIIGNGLREDNETLINGAVVQLIEKVEIDGTTYEYIWREMESGDANLKYLDYDGNLQTGTIYKDENGNDYVWNSEDMSANYSEYAGDLLSGSISAQNGYYFFDKYIPGNYIVRFIYGDNASTIQTNENGGKNAISYNGQDYKSTWYTANEYEANSIRFYDLSSNDANASKARDNAIRRLNVNEYSKTMNNHIGNVLAAPYATPEDSALIQELRNNTWMYADTAYINAEVAYNTTGTDLEESQLTAPVYKVENIGFGLEERPRTNIVLTKQIENATITLVNGTVLMDTASGIRNGIKTVPNKYEHSEQGKKNYLGFWAYEIDDELIQGAELKIYYRLTVENKGEVDTVGTTYNLNAIPSDLREAEAMLGNAYYYGNADNTRLVTTSIDKILDYIDGSIVFNPNMESNKDVWYDVESLEELKNAGLVDAKVEIIEDTSNNTMAMTESLKDIPLNPVDKTSTSTLLVLTKILGSNSDKLDYMYGNIAEIIQFTNTVGRRGKYQIPGNQDPNIINKNGDTPSPLELENDTDVAESFTITKPTGLDQSIGIYILGGIAAAILAVGVVLIKKFVLSKK